MFGKKTWIRYILFFFVVLTKAQTYNFHQYNEENGLQQNYIYSISQSPRGFLVLSAGESLYRFDGREFIEYSDERVKQNFIVTHFVDSKYVVWVGHNQNGISYLKDDKFYGLTNDKIANAKVTGIIDDNGRGLWVATNGAGLFRVDSAKTLYAVKSGEQNNIIAICKGSANHLLLGTPEGIRVVERRADADVAVIATVNELENKFVKQIIRGFSPDLYWVLTESDGIFAMTYSKGVYKTILHLQDELNAENAVTYLYSDDIGNLWVSILGEGLRKISFTNPKNLQRFAITSINKNNGLKSDHIQSICQDREGNIWLGTFGQGLIQKPAEKFSFFGVQEGIAQNDIKEIISDSMGKLWLGSSMGLASFSPSDNQYQIYSASDGFVTEQVNALLLEENGDMWIGTTSGIFVREAQSGTFRNISKERKLDRVSVSCLVKQKDNIIAGTTEGIYFIQKSASTVSRMTTNEGLLHNNIKSMYVDSKDRLWICSHGTPLYYLRDRKIYPFKDLSGQNTFKINSVYEDKKGDVWIATDGDGIFRYDNKVFEHFTTKNGLLSDYCNGISIDSSQTVWVTHRGGLSEKRADKKKFSPISEKMGLLFYENNLNSVHKDNKSQLWFGTSTGIVLYDPQLNLHRESRPEVFINRVSFNNEIENISQKIEKKYGYYSIHIDYQAISLSNRENIYYKYRLLDIDTAWKISNTPDIDFPKLGDGNYTFEVIACNISSGLCGSTPARVRFVINKPIWKVLWFWLAVLAVVITITYMIVDSRTKRLKGIQHLLQLKVKQKTFLLQREKEAVEKIKVELENRNKDITDSISYAKNIQYSMLPPEETMQDLFGHNYFVLFKPKDIVSGDFYWAAALNVNNNNKKPLSLAAVIDCTGHGVPGAFLSIMANDFLKQSIIDKKVNNTNEILDFLNEEVASHFNHSVTKSRMNDGMDIALVGIDFSGKKLYYSGANNPVYVFRKESVKTQTFILKPTKQAIGQAGESAARYDVQIFELQQGDTIYLFSDGFADQFGGEKNKKLTYKRFRQILEEAFEKPITEQKEFLDVRLEGWKNGTEQTDDVCVMGIRI